MLWTKAFTGAHVVKAAATTAGGRCTWVIAKACCCPCERLWLSSSIVPARCGSIPLKHVMAACWYGQSGFETAAVAQLGLAVKCGANGVESGMEQAWLGVCSMPHAAHSQHVWLCIGVPPLLHTSRHLQHNYSVQLSPRGAVQKVVVVGVDYVSTLGTFC